MRSTAVIEMSFYLILIIIIHGTFATKCFCMFEKVEDKQIVVPHSGCVAREVTLSWLEQCTCSMRLNVSD